MRQSGAGLERGLTHVPTGLTEIARRAGEYGLVVRGGFTPVAEDAVPPLDGGKSANTLLLFGNAGSSIWQSFSTSAEYLDGEADPLNRWSMRIGNMLATEWEGNALFPFGGPPYQPFLKWAKKSEGIASSKLGMLIHPVYGLWHAYRFAVALPVPIAITPEGNAGNHACDACAKQPCLRGCPVNAFDGTQYDVEACYKYLVSNPDSACQRSGCAARKACPEGTGYAYQPAHAAFHMGKFILSQADRFEGDPQPVE